MPGKKHPHAQHSWALRLECDQITPLEDKTDHQVFKNNCTSPQEWTVGLVQIFLFVRSGLRSHSYQRRTLVLQIWMNRISARDFLENVKPEAILSMSIFIYTFSRGTRDIPVLHVLCPPASSPQPTLPFHSFPFQCVIIVFPYFFL